MFGVSFAKNGDEAINTSDYNMYLTSKSIEAPVPKTEYIDIPGMNGTLDCTEAFGPVRYKDRKITMNFDAKSYGGDFHELFGQLNNDLLGQYFDGIIFDDDPDWQYSGRVTGIKSSNSKATASFTIECSCAPFRKSSCCDEVSVAFHNWDLSSSSANYVTLHCVNDLREVHPEITVSMPVYVTAPVEEGDGIVMRKIFIAPSSESETIPSDDAVKDIVLPAGASSLKFEKIPNGTTVTYTFRGKTKSLTIFTTLNGSSILSGEFKASYRKECI